MAKTVIIPEGTGTPLAPYVPATLADNIVYVSGTLPLDTTYSRCSKARTSRWSVGTDNIDCCRQIAHSVPK